MFALKNKKTGELVMRKLVNEPFYYTTRKLASLGKKHLEEDRKEEYRVVEV